MGIKVTDIIHDNDGTVKIFYEIRIVENYITLINGINGCVTIPSASFAKLKDRVEKPEDFIMLLLHTESTSLIKFMPDYLDASILFNLEWEEQK
jgi:calcineurin-like phosphoesterase